MSEACLPGDADPAQADQRRISFERLRERTDELELIVSGLLAFALLALPGWIFDGWADASAHLEGFWQFVMLMGYMLGSGLSYTLAAAFLLHLAVRGYWVGLIGLKATFTKGIRWDAIGTMGPIAREYYQARVPDLLSAIDRADRAGSILFAMAILIALMLAWIAVVMAALVLIGAGLGWLIGDFDRGVMIALGAFYVALTLGALVLVLIDAVLVKRRPELQHSPGLRSLLHAVIRCYAVILPQRLILPVQLTLQSNLSGKLFMLALTLISALAPMIGVSHLLASREFTLSGGYVLLDDETVDNGMLSAHYESLRGERDRLLRYPMIPSDLIGEAYLRLFIPNLPDRDNPLLRQRCPALPPGEDAPQRQARAEQHRACIAALWTVSLNGAPVELAAFLPAERRDLGLRGLQGYLPLTHLAEGRHDLFLVWNSEGGDSGRQRRREYRIPFWLAPGVETELEAVVADAATAALSDPDSGDAIAPDEEQQR